MKTDPRKAAALRHLQQTLGYEFHQLDLLKQALTHRSFAAKNNERFEFVGDAILNYTVAKMLFVAFPKLSEGELSRLRANLVNQDTLAEMALAMQVGDALYLGQGELKSGGFRRPSILADAMEAMFAAISFDADFARAEKVVRNLFAERIKSIDPGDSGKDAKTRLQEYLQARQQPLPAYNVLEIRGEPHAQSFTVECAVADCRALAVGSNRRKAEQDAARQILEQLMP